MSRSLIDSVHSSTVSNSPMFSTTHSSVSSGSDSSWTALTVTVKSAGSSVPFGVVVNVSTSPADGAGELLVEVVGDPALAELVGPVLGVETEHLLAVAGGGEVERDVVAGGGGTVDVDQRPALAQLGLLGLVDLVVGGPRASRARSAALRSRGR